MGKYSVYLAFSLDSSVEIRSKSVQKLWKYAIYRTVTYCFGIICYFYVFHANHTVIF